MPTLNWIGKAAVVKHHKIDAAVFDLMAVNPTAVVDVDIRTPQQIIGNIEEQGRIVADSLVRLNI